jgi:hypothetical protein
MMDAARLRSLVQDKFLSMLIHRSAGDTRTREQLYRQAARETVREERLRQKFSPNTNTHTPVTASNAFDQLVGKLWGIIERRKSTSIVPGRGQLPQPSIISNPVIIADEPITPATNVIPFRETAAPLVVAGNGGAKLLDDQQFAAKYHSPVTQTWRQSIAQNQRIAKEREARSIQHRSQQKYVG